MPFKEYATDGFSVLSGTFLSASVVLLYSAYRAGSCVSSGIKPVVETFLGVAPLLDTWHEQ